MAQKTLSLIPTRGPVDRPLLQGLHWLCNASSRKLMFGSSSALGLWGQRVGVRAQIFLSDPLQVLDCISWCWVLQPGFQRNWVCLHLVNGDNGLGEDKMRKDIKVFWKHFQAHMSISVVIIVFKCPNHPWCEEFQWLGMHQAEIHFYRVREKNTRFFPDLLIELICSEELLKLTGYWLKSHLLVPPPPPTPTAPLGHKWKVQSDTEHFYLPTLSGDCCTLQSSWQHLLSMTFFFKCFILLWRVKAVNKITEYSLYVTISNTAVCTCNI